MKENIKYDPEDLESLLAHKSFSDLYEAEKAFVLKHIADENEYTELRKTLALVNENDFSEGNLVAPPKIKAALMEKFAQEKKGGFWIWLNTTLASLIPTNLFARPAVGWSLAAVVCVVAVWWVWPSANFTAKDVAHTAETNKQQNVIETPEAKKNTDGFAEGKNATRELEKVENANKEFAPEPAVIEPIIDPLHGDFQVLEYADNTMGNLAVEEIIDLEEDALVDFETPEAGTFVVTDDAAEAETTNFTAPTAGENLSASGSAVNESIQNVEATRAVAMDEVLARKEGKGKDFGAKFKRDKSAVLDNMLKSHEDLLDELFTAL